MQCVALDGALDRSRIGVDAPVDAQRCLVDLLVPADREAVRPGAFQQFRDELTLASRGETHTQSWLTWPVTDMQPSMLDAISRAVAPCGSSRQMRSVPFRARDMISTPAPGCCRRMCTLHIFAGRHLGKVVVSLRITRTDALGCSITGHDRLTVRGSNVLEIAQGSWEGLRCRYALRHVGSHTALNTFEALDCIARWRRRATNTH